MNLITSFFNNFKFYIIAGVITAILSYVGYLKVQLYFADRTISHKNDTILGLQQGLVDMQIMMEKRITDEEINSHKKVHDEQVKQVINRNSIVIGNQRL